MEKLKNFINEYISLITIIVLVGGTYGGACIYSYLNPGVPEQELTIKEGWNSYYKNKYFVNIYDQLKKVNKHATNEDIQIIASAIIDSVQYKYSVSQLPLISNDSLSQIAYRNSKIEQEITDGDGGSETVVHTAYTETLVLNVDLTK